jgi:ABC-type cobalamin/Fe3+-siderophores transport system ATPase subunit
MRITIDNIGKVRKANVALDGITTIAGSNGTGKSTVGRVLVTFLNVMRQMGALLINKKLFYFFEGLQRLLKLPDSWHLIASSALSRAAGNGVSLQPESWDAPDKVRKFLFEAAKYAGAQKRLSDHAATVEIDCDQILGRLSEVNSLDEHKESIKILNDVFMSAFSKQMSPVFDHAALGHIMLSDDGDDVGNSIDVKNDHVVDFGWSSNLAAPPAFYIEPIHVLDVAPLARQFFFDPAFFDKYRSGAFGAQYAISNTDYDVTYSDEEEKRSVSDLIRELSDIISGSIEKDDEGVELKFAEKHGDNNIGFVHLENLASGMKTISVLVHALRNGTIRRGRVVVIDEPESNLHPEWQVRFARMLVALNKKLSVKVLLNTHSPYFLKAIEYYSEKEDIGGVKFYQMVQEPDGLLYLTDDCTGNTNKIFQSMYKPFQDIM